MKENHERAQDTLEEYRVALDRSLL
jgi:hypothetical protein